MALDLVTGGVFLAVGLLVFLVGDAFLSGGRERVSTLGQPKVVVPSRRRAGWITRFFSWVIPQMPSEVESIQKDLNRAGYYQPTALTEYLASRNFLLLVVIGGTALLWWSARADKSVQNTIFIVGGVVAVLGFALPRVLLMLNAKARIDRIQTGLPDALDMITMCLTGGLPLQDALGRVTEDLQFSHSDVAAELEIIRRQADANSLGHALQQFSARIDAAEIKSLAALVSQTERLGTNVAIALREFADSLRRGQRHRAEERANKTSVKILFPVVLCLAPPIFILLCGPALISMRNFLVKENRPGGALSTNVNTSGRMPVSAVRRRIVLPDVQGFNTTNRRPGRGRSRAARPATAAPAVATPRTAGAAGTTRS